MDKKKKKVTFEILEEDYLQLRVKALMRKMTMQDLFIEMIHRYRRHPDDFDPQVYESLKRVWDQSPIAKSVSLNEKEKKRRLEIFDIIKDLRAKNLSGAKIATELERRKIPTLSGRGKWYRSTVLKLLKEGV